MLRFATPVVSARAGVRFDFFITLNEEAQPLNISECGSTSPSCISWMSLTEASQSPDSVAMKAFRVRGGANVEAASVVE